MKLTSKVQVKNKEGLHARPATSIVKMLQDTKCDVMFTYKGETVNAKSILSILMLEARHKAKITITVQGDDAPVTLEKLVTAFDKEFEE